MFTPPITPPDVSRIIRTRGRGRYKVCRVEGSRVYTVNRKGL